MWQMVGILAELERALIQERTKAGRVAAKARGVKMGRKFKLSPPQASHARVPNRSPAGATPSLGVPPMVTGLAVLGRREDGQAFPVAVSLSPLWLEDELFVVCLIQDAAARAQEDAAQQRTELLAILGQLAATVSHEIRTPRVTQGAPPEAQHGPAPLVAPCRTVLEGTLPHSPHPLCLSSGRHYIKGALWRERACHVFQSCNEETD